MFLNEYTGRLVHDSQTEKFFACPVCLSLGLEDAWPNMWGRP